MYLYFCKKYRTKLKSSNVKPCAANAAIDSFDAHPVFLREEIKSKKNTVEAIAMRMNIFMLPKNVPFELF